MARDWKFCIKKIEELYYPYSQNKGADQLRSYCETDLRLCFHICRAKLICAFVFPYADCWFSHEVSQMTLYLINYVHSKFCI